MIASLRPLVHAVGLSAVLSVLSSPLPAQVLLEEPRRLLLDSLLPRPKAPGEDLRVGDAIYRYRSDPLVKGGASLNAQLWPGGRVPFLMSSASPLGAEDRDRVLEAMRTWERATGGAVSFQEIAGPSDEQIVVMSASRQGVRQSFQDAPEFPVDYVRSKWDEGYRIQHAVQGAGGWQVLMADGLGWGAQSWRKRAYWPKEEIRQLWDEGKHVTTIAYGGGEWFVALTEGTGISEQGWDTSDQVAPNEVADRRWADGFRITGLAWGGGVWGVISSKGTDLAEQSMFWNVTFPEADIKARWVEGHEITALARSDTHWVVVMSLRR